jgi:LysM repeat protein
MDRPIVRVILASVVVTLSLGTAVACSRAKPAEEAGPQPTLTLAFNVLEQATVAVVLPVVGGVVEDDTPEPLETPVQLPSPTATPEPTVELTEQPTELPPTTVVLESTPAPPAEITHTVSAGETLLSIAVKYRTTTKAIVERNSLVNPDFIRIGQTLLIPVDPATLSTLTPVDVAPVATRSAAPARTHRVEPGETLSSIAARYGLTTAELAKANHLADPNLVFAGQQLVIPE